VGVPKFSQLGLPQLWGPITLRANLRLRWGLMKSYSHCQEFSNDVSHTTCTWGNRGDSWLLMVGSFIVNLTPDPSFGYNLCVKVSKWVMWAHFKILCSKSFSMILRTFPSNGFWPLQSLSKDSRVHWDSNSQNVNSLESVRVHSLTLSCTPKSMKCDSRVSYLARTFRTLALVTNPRLRSWHKTHDNFPFTKAYVYGYCKLHHIC